jgi:hypothetical protein
MDFEQFETNCTKQLKTVTQIDELLETVWDGETSHKVFFKAMRVTVSEANTCESTTQSLTDILKISKKLSAENYWRIE